MNYFLVNQTLEILFIARIREGYPHPKSVGEDIRGSDRMTQCVCLSKGWALLSSASDWHEQYNNITVLCKEVSKIGLTLSLLFAFLC